MGKARRAYSEEVRSLVREVQARDPRVLQHNLRLSRQRLERKARRDQFVSKGHKDVDVQGDGSGGVDALESDVGEEEKSRERDRERERAEYQLQVDRLLEDVLREEEEEAAKASQARQSRRQRARNMPLVAGDALDCGGKGVVDDDDAGGAYGESVGEAGGVGVVEEQKAEQEVELGGGVGEVGCRQRVDDEAFTTKVRIERPCAFAVLCAGTGDDRKVQ